MLKLRDPIDKEKFKPLVDVNQRGMGDKFLFTPLFIAVRQRDVEMVELFLQQPEIDVNAACEEGQYTALYEAMGKCAP